MARTNVRVKLPRAITPVPMTHNGAPAAVINPLQQLRRSVMSCFLWEKEFYEDGQEIASRIRDLCVAVSPTDVAALAIEARNEGKLRHVPLLLVAVLAKHASGTSLLSRAIPQVVQRADELGELLSLYWKLNGKDAPLSAQLKKGLAAAFRNFDNYQYRKYASRDGEIKLRDVMFLTHPSATKDGSNGGGPYVMVDEIVNATGYSRGRVMRGDTNLMALAANSLEPAETWEVELSAGGNKGEVFTRLLTEEKLGYLALLRNLRNMQQGGVDERLISNAILARRGAQRVLPFRYIAAARAAPQFEKQLDNAMQHAVLELPKFDGRTVILVDVSGSMDEKLSLKSDLRRKDAAGALAALINGNNRVFSFADKVMEIPPRNGMALIDAIMKSQSGGTRLFDAVRQINDTVPYDRLIVVTDEQANNWAGIYERSISKGLPDPITRGYMINVASAKNGVGYGKWVHIDGFSENVIRFISAYENQ